MQAYELDCPERLRAHLARTRQLYQPLADGQGTLRWQRLNADDERPFVMPAEPPVFSAKAFFFAEREAVFRFDGERFVAIEPVAARQIAGFGAARSVDGAELRAAIALAAGPAGPVDPVGSDALTPG